MATNRPDSNFAKQLRRNQTDVERKLCLELLDSRFQGAKFRRQAPTGPYVVDFLCLESKLIIELDGSQHAIENPERQTWLESKGFRLLRFWKNEITENLPRVLAVIKTHLEPSPAGGRGHGEGGPQ